MVRPRGKSNPKGLLSAATGSAANVSALSLQLPPLSRHQLPPATDEDLESQARAALSLFGFGASSAVKWSSVPSESVAAAGVLLMERVCPIGTNQFLWNTMHSGNSGSASAVASASASNIAIIDTMATGVDPISGADLDSVAAEYEALNAGHLYASKLLQQYFVKCVCVMPATVAEVVDVIIRSDREDMEVPMQRLVGVKASASGLVYMRRKRKTKAAKTTVAGPRKLTSAPSNHSILSNGSSNRHHRSKTMSNRRLKLRPPPHLGTSGESSSSDSEHDLDEDSDEESVVCVDENHASFLSDRNRTSTRFRPTLTPISTSASPSRLTTTSTAPTSSPSLERHTSSSSTGGGGGLASSYMEEYQNALQADPQGNLSIKWVLGEKSGRMFASRANYCLLDYECMLVNDWEPDEHERAPMYVRTLQSCYLPQCQPWMDEFNGRPVDLQPTGIMVREAKNHEGYVEVQFVASILEKAQLPMGSRRAKVRSLCLKITKLEEIVTSRRLSQSFLAHRTLWVRNHERPRCHSCEAQFSISRRRHHCRLCGEVCCSECCPKMDVALPDVGTTSLRVCVVCVRKRRRHSADSVGSSSSSCSSSTAAPMASPTNRPPTGLTASMPSTPGPYLASSASPSDHYLSPSNFGFSSSSYSGSGIGERKQSLASSMFQKFKSSSMG